MKIEIDVKTDASKPVEETPAQQQDTIYPTKPFGKRDETQMTLDILFYNGVTRRDPNDSSGFSVWNKFDDSTIQYDETHETADWNGDSFSYHFIQNNFNPTDDDYFALWGGDNPYDRQPLEKYNYGDIENNAGVIPVGATKSNITVALVDAEGNELETMSAYRLLKSEIPGELLSSAEGMGYRWLNPPAGFHIKVYDDTAKSHYTVAGAGVGYFPGHEVYDLWNGWYGMDLIGQGTQEKIDYTMENLFWHTFDTSDTDNFKLTKVPRYNCAPEDEYQDDQVLKLDSVYMEIKLFLIPRPWHGFFRFSTYTAEYAHGLNTDVCYGVWSPCPRNFMMAPPRTAGQWEIGVCAGTAGIGPFGDYWLMPIDDPAHGTSIVYTGEEKGVVLDLAGDTEQDNSFYLLHTVPCLRSNSDYPDSSVSMALEPNTETWTSFFDCFKPLVWEYTPIWNPDYSRWDYYLTFPAHNSSLFGQWMKDESGLSLASADGLYRWHYGDWHSGVLFNVASVRGGWGPYFSYPEAHYQLTDGTYTSYMRLAYIHNNFRMHLEGFWGSAPDGKVLTMVSRDTPSGISPLKNGVTLGKQPLVYDPDAYTNKSVETVIVEHFLTRGSCNRGGQSPDSYMFSIGEAKEGDLVGVIVTRDQPIYVWRKTDEDIQRVDSNDNELIVGSNQQWDKFKSYKLTSAIPCSDLYNMIPNTFEHLHPD